MSKMAPKKLHPLRYESYENLKKHALNIDKQLSNSLKRLSNFKRLKYLLETEREARMKLQDGDEENAYILYNRALAIYRMISDAKDDTFNRSKDGRLFYDTSHRMCSDLEKVTENLQQRFRHSQENASTITKMKSLSVSRPVDTTFESYAKPVEIVRFVAQGMNALVLDYRDKQSETIEYKSPRGTMEVVHINQRDIMPGSLLPSIFKALDISFRPLLEKISHFDLVALLGDVNDTSKEKGTKTFILNEALTTYNFYYKLKRPPVIIEGGFMNWKNAYPQYINQTSDVPGFEKTFDEQFAIWIIESKKANELRIHYPCLTGFVKESAPFDDHHNPVEEAPKQQYQRSHSTTSVFSYPSEALNHSTANSASHYTNKEVIRDLPNQLDKKAAADESHQIAKKPMQIPVIDRSKKPPIVVNKSFSDQNQKRPTLKDRECRNVHYNKENCAPADGPTRSTSPFPQVLGGLGGQNGLDEINQRRRIPEGNFGNHAGPPHPRRRQAPVIPSAREELTPARPPLPPSRQEATADDGVPHYFRSSYQMSLQKMSYDSEYKQMPPGQTGLFNMGNTCFMNSTLQPLFHTPDFSELFRDNNAFRYINEKNKFGTKGIISGSFSALIDLMWSGKFSAVRPSLFLEFFAKRVNAELADRQQHDAQEFQIYLLDALHEDTNKVSFYWVHNILMLSRFLVDTRQLFEQNYDSTNLQASAVDFFQRSNLFSSSPVNDLFNLTTISVIQCCTCNTTSVRFEAVNQISVELPNVDYLKLKDCLEAHFSTTNLEAPWDCPKCKSKESAKRSTKIWLVPKVLIIHLKRFSLNDLFFVKNEVEVTFDVNELDLSPYIHSKSPLVNATYSLYAVTNHSGRLNSGHYTSNVINLASTERNWLHFDDETCSPSSAPSPTSKQVFLLYYKLTSSQTK